MLWKKESDRSDAMYVDICEISTKAFGLRTIPFLADHIVSTLNKNDSIALEKRMKANEFYGNGEIYATIEMYNQSLCFAEPESPHISLAYANRAACFLKLEKYKKCLTDIELAIEHGYPEHLKSKLEKRKSVCLRYMETEENDLEDANEPKLSFEPNEMYPYLANVVDFQRDENGKYSVVAKEDIAVGQTIAIEEAFTTCLNMRYHWNCTICMKDGTNLMPCKKCTIAMFCSDECQRNEIHEHECGVVFKNMADGMENVRSILKVINMFSNNS